MNHNQQEPLILRMDEAKRELVQCVNDILTRHGLNCYLIEPMFAELYTQIKSGAQNELAQARAQEITRKQIEGAAEVAPQGE